MKALGLLPILIFASACGTTSVEYFWNEKVFDEVKCFRTVFIGPSQDRTVSATEPAFVHAIRKAGRGQSLPFHFVDTIERADVVMGVMKHPKVVTTHAETSVDTNWTMTLVGADSALRTAVSEPGPSVLVTGEVGFGASIPKQVIRALDHVHQTTCRE